MFSQKRSGWKFGGVVGAVTGVVGVVVWGFGLSFLPALVLGGLLGAVVGELAETQVLPKVPMGG